MTLADLMRALWKRWYVVAVAAALTLGLAYLSTRTEPMYQARTEVVFLAPTSTRYPNELVTSSESLIFTAGIVAERINGAGEQLKFGSAAATPIGSPDITETTWIRLLDTGNQWIAAFEQQVLVISTVGTTPERAQDRVREAYALIEDELRALESEHGVDPINSIGLRMSPEAPQIVEVDGSGPRAAGMTLVLGVLGTIAVVVILEVRASARNDPEQKRGRSVRRRRAQVEADAPRL
ncbi:hypothetical protein [Microbacterium sp. CGR1]|uniref:hypothetical protein n=1 Tax=Microbacterium sp. CGR1 TaxID=1696072 RepID=UPI003DA35A6D